jgi:hypothetical protein
VVALAADEGEYIRIVRKRLSDDNLLVMEFSETAPRHQYRQAGRLSPYLESLCESITPSFPVQFHTFYDYDADD